MSGGRAGYKQGHMLRIPVEARRGLFGAAFCLSVLAPLAAQEKDDPSAAIEKWLATDHTSSRLMRETVQVVCDAEKGLAVLGSMQPMIAQKPDAPRSKGLRSLMVQVTLEHLRRTYKSGMVFVGQYDGLKPLQPWVDPFLFELLLDTPEWYPFTFRVRLVPAIRDLQRTLPGEDRVRAVLELVEDDREPTDLRQALAAMLWQWGKKKPAEAFVQELQRATTEGDGEDRVNATLHLADYYNLLRDYKRAAGAHRAAQALARGADYEMRPIAWYAAACVHALAGQKELGMKALERCAQMHASPDLDRSLRLERSLFEKDPEIALLRADERFAALLRVAFGDEPAKKDKGSR